MNRENRENTTILNERKAKRLNCKRGGKTYFPGLDTCAGSWDTFASTDFNSPGSDLTLFGKKPKWNFTLSGSSFKYGAIGKITDTGNYLAYTGAFSQLAGKTITIELDNTVGTNLLSGWTKAYIADFGNEKWFIVNTGNKCLTTIVTSPTLCKTIDTINSIVPWNGGITIPVTLSTVPTQMIIGNQGNNGDGVFYAKPIGATIRKISIQIP